MRAATAYFVGAGTIVVAIAIGLGGGIVAGNIMNPIAPKYGPDTGKLAQRGETAATAATPVMSAPSERVQYLTGSQAFGTMIAPPAQAQPQTTTANVEPPAPQPVTAGNSTPANAPFAEPAKSDETKSTEAKPARVKTIETKSADAKASDIKPADQPAEKQAVSEPAAVPDGAYAKAKDSDVRRATAERRRVDRRERWAERRHYDARDPREMRGRTDWDDIARNIREDSDARDIATSRRGPPDRGFPQIRLFGPDDD